MINHLNISRVFALLIFFTTLVLQANSSFIIEDDNLIDKRAIKKISQIGLEVQSKLGVNIYIYAKNSYINKQINSIDKRLQIIKSTENKIIRNLKKPYVLITLALDFTHVNIIYSNSLKNIIDKDDILDGYIVPLLASKDKNSLNAKVSAALLNGYAQVGDVLAQQKGIKLDSSIGSGGKTAGTIWKVFMYFLVIGGLLLYVYATLRAKKYQ
jgi:hypothetical protein